jgi:hypothetical protein
VIDGWAETLVHLFYASPLCELKHNWDIQSGFEIEVELGQKWYLPDAAGNNINRASFEFH